MSPDDERALSTLLSRRVATLGVIEGGEPVLGLVPFALARGGATAWVHLSRLSRHGRALADGAVVSLLVHEDDAPDRDPLQLQRLTLDAVAATPADAEREAGCAAYLARFPDAAVTFGLGDFALWALRLRGGRLVAGFGRARTVSSGDLARLAPP